MGEKYDGVRAFWNSDNNVVYALRIVSFFILIDSAVTQEKEMNCLFRIQLQRTFQIYF